MAGWGDFGIGCWVGLRLNGELDVAAELGCWISLPHVQVFDDNGLVMKDGVLAQLKRVFAKQMM
jgi:hypothetical protein